MPQDGAIDHDEFRAGLAALGANLSEAQIEDLISMLDKVDECCHSALPFAVIHRDLLYKAARGEG